MKSIKISLAIVLCSVSLCLSNLALASSSLEIQLSNIKKSAGTIRIAIFNSKDTFMKTRFESIIQKASDITEMSFTIEDLPDGQYGVMLFQDINDNNELDSNLLGLPREPWGASIRSKTLFSAPQWNDVVFELNNSNEVMEIAFN